MSDLISLGDIHPSPTNPRKHFDEDKLQALAKTIEAHDVLQPILLRPWPDAYTFVGERPSYEIVAGERRYRASTMAGKTHIPAVIRELTDDEVLEIQVVENLQRDDLTALEEAEGYALMLKRGHRAEDLGKRIGKSKAYIYARVKLTALCLKAREAYAAGKLTPSTALLIARIPTVDLQEQALKAITEAPDWVFPNGIRPYRDAERVIHQDYMLHLPKAKFSPADATLCPAAGDCLSCPKRTGNNPELYGDVGSADVCTDPTCYKAKVAAQAERESQAAQAEGRKVITGEAAAKVAPYGTDSSLTGYIALDRPNHDLPRSAAGAVQTTREALQGLAVETVLIEDVRYGGLIEAIPKAQLAPAMATVGIHYKDSDEAYREKQRAEERLARQETTWRTRLFEDIHEAVDKALDVPIPADLTDRELRIVTRHMWARTDYENRKRVAATMIAPGEKMDGHERCAQVTEQIKTMDRRALLLLLLDCALIGQVHVSAGYTITPPQDLLDMAGYVGIDAKSIQDEVARQFAGPAKGKKPPATAAKTTSTPPEAPPAEETDSAKKPNTEAAIQTDEDRYAEAVKVVTESGKASISHLQRTLRIGYNQAARLIEAMEKAGLVGRDGNGKLCLAKAKAKVEEAAKEPELANVGDRIRILAPEHQIEGKPDETEVCHAYANGTILTRAHFENFTDPRAHRMHPGEYEILERAITGPYTLGQTVRLIDCGIMVKKAGGKGVITSIYSPRTDRPNRYYVRYGGEKHEVIPVTADNLAPAPEEDKEPAAPLTPEEPLAIGDPVKVKDDARGPAGMRRKCAGRIGRLLEVLPHQVAVQFASGPLYGLSLDDLEKLPTPLTAAQAAEIGAIPNPAGGPASTPTGNWTYEISEIGSITTGAGGEQPGESIETDEKPTAAHRPPVRYRHPDNRDLEWTGRGRKPQWVLEWLKSHPDGRLEDLDINPSSAAPAANETPTAADERPRCDKTVDMFQEAA